MSDQALPQTIDPLRMAASQVQLAGSLEIAKLSRLRALVFDEAGTVKVQLEFGTDAEGFAFVKGELETQLRFQCQRCLKALTHQLKLPILLSPVASIEQAKALPELYEPLMFVDDPLLLTDIIEDEILLNIPFAPMHSEQECSVKLEREQEIEDDFVKENPFKKLANLKIVKKSNSR